MACRYLNLILEACASYWSRALLSLRISWMSSSLCFCLGFWRNHYIHISAFISLRGSNISLWNTVLLHVLWHYFINWCLSINLNLACFSNRLFWIIYGSSWLLWTKLLATVINLNRCGVLLRNLWSLSWTNIIIVHIWIKTQKLFCLILSVHLSLNSVIISAASTWRYNFGLTL